MFSAYAGRDKVTHAERSGILDGKYSPERSKYSVYTVYPAHFQIQCIYNRPVCLKSAPNTVYIQCIWPCSKYSEYVSPI